MQCALAQASLKARKLASGSKPRFPKEDQCLFDGICEKDRMDIQSPVVKLKLRFGNLPAISDPEHLLAGYMDFSMNYKLLSRASIMAINKVNSSMQHTVIWICQ
jgi:hypothetical protein